MVYGDTERRTYRVLTTVTLTDRVFLIVRHLEIKLQQVQDLACFLGQSVFLDKRHDTCFDRSEYRRKVQHDAGVAAFQRLLLITRAHDAQEHTVHTDGGLDDIRRIGLIELRVEILNLFARIFRVRGEVEVRTAVDTFHFLETKRHEELDVRCSVCVVG